jgi:FKBP-type peptidyl-prolyl cis-trans isomerase FkpA
MRVLLSCLVVLTLLLACAEADDVRSADTQPAVAASGELEITHLEVGTGASPSATDTVQVHYHGTFPDGRVFDSSVDRGQPAAFPLNRVIACWTEGVQKMKVGGKAKLVCPPALAYGERGAPPTIPPNATLVFEVELLAIR